MKATLGLLVLGSALALSGCAHYNYYVVEPTQYAQRITKQTIRVRFPPLEYRMAEVQGRLAMNIDNPTTNVVNLLGHKSYVVDPRGLTHPVQQRLIAPHSFIPLMLPPPPLTYHVYNPYPYPFYRAWWGWSPLYYPAYDPWFFYEPPPYTYTYQVRTPYNWDWKEGEVRAHFVYEQAGQTIEHHFVFERRQSK